ncbi:hypothetical protein EsH8_VI_000382 [Colletotrichum jinshuiense]
MNCPKPFTFLLYPFAIKLLVALAIVIILLRTSFLYLELDTAAHIDRSVPAHTSIKKATQCLPEPSPRFYEKLESLRSSCQLGPNHHQNQSRVITATAHFGKLEAHYQKALQTHMLHAEVHGTGLEVMCTPVIDDLWNKPAFLLSLLVGEMLKRPGERAEWIFWVDRDTVILDQCRPASSFLPRRPSGADSGSAGELADNDLRLLVTNDWNGLNNGVFLLRVGQWAVELFSAIVAFRYYRPDTNLPFTEQSAMEILMKEPKFKGGVQFVPQYWFNTYPSGNASVFLERNDEQGLADYHARRGDFLLHFAGLPEKDKAINNWVEMLDDMPTVFEAGNVQRNATPEIETFWRERGTDRDVK